jgi:hypothetical protein
MTGLASLVGQEFIWQKVKAPGVRRAREIVIDGEIWSRIRRVKAFGSLASVESKTGTWSLKRVGWFRTRITVRSGGEAAENLAVFTPSFTWFGSAGTLQLAGGRSFRWAGTKSFGREHTFFDENQMPVLRFRGGTGKCRMTFGSVPEFPELPLLGALGFYIIQLNEEDAGAIAGAAAAAAAG